MKMYLLILKQGNKTIHLEIYDKDWFSTFYENDAKSTVKGILDNLGKQT